ncbi:GNAT family N-acetyltransferase [Paenibacillus chitinolyticus]|uniref:GNAT family N-acetyltransferase n=1 Tax=Paenibacillus chitinolyticus TaxID=79263 RepID=UPI0035D83E2A
MNKVQFDEVFELMEASFPDTEIRTCEGQRALLAHPAYRLNMSRNESGEILAFMGVWEFEAFRFVEHIAVNPEQRGGGIGKKLMAAYTSGSSTPVILEVEPANDTDSKRRIEFYERLGFHLNAFDYFQPPLREGQPELALQIMSYPEPMSEEEFQPYKKVLMAEVYKQA